MADRLTRQSSTASRRTLERRPSTASARRNVFSDDYSVDADDFLIADGFRPEPMTRPESSTTPQPPSPSTTPRSQPIRHSTRRAPPRPSEESKPEWRKSMMKTGLGGGGMAQNEFSLQHDADAAPQRMNSTRTEMSQRPNSTISMFSLPREPSPYLGASGPSHPYGMYPQDTSLNRSSTISSGLDAAPRRPAHPYGMYPQTTADPDPLSASADIATVGFPGLGRTYARRLGPDGEDADDIIGPDGHTEQLPPYTRYPDGNPRFKERYAPPRAAAASSSRPPSTRSSILLAADPVVDEAIAQPATSSARAPLLEDDTEADTEAASSNDSTQAQPKWARRSKKRFFGGRIPAWCICIGFAAVIALAATLGGAIGHSIASQHGNHGDFDDKNFFPTATTAAEGIPTSVPTTIISITTTLIDATSVATPPPNLPKLPQGTYNLQLNAPIEASSSCVTDPNQAGAGVWGCTNAGDMTWIVKPSDIDSTQVFLAGTTDYGLQYGPQPPTMQGPIGLALMSDVEQPTRGPAFFFQSAYTKTVILPEAALDANATKRSVTDRSGEALHPVKRDGGHVSPGDNAWYCYWNNTLLEGFIYVTPAANSSASSTASAAFSTISPSTTPAARLRERDHVGGGGGGRHHFFEDHFKDTQENTNPSYPFPMKFEERRSPANEAKPYCQKMKVNNDMSISPVQPPETVQLSETDPETQERFGPGGSFGGKKMYARSMAAERERAKRITVPTACICQWSV